MGFEPQTLEFKVNLHSQPKNKPYGTLKFDKTLLKIKSLTENESQGSIKWLIWTFLGTYSRNYALMSLLRRASTFIQARALLGCSP